MEKLLKLRYENRTVRIKNELISLTDLWQAAGKPEGKHSPRDWKRKVGQAFIEAVVKKLMARLYADMPDNLSLMKPVLEYANREGRALLTINRKHFIHLHKMSSSHAGIVVCSFDPRFVEQAHRIHQTLETYKGDLRGQLLRINRSQTS